MKLLIAFIVEAMDAGEAEGLTSADRKNFLDSL
jgi:hypothetical protein